MKDPPNIGSLGRQEWSLNYVYDYPAKKLNDSGKCQRTTKEAFADKDSSSSETLISRYDWSSRSKPEPRKLILFRRASISRMPVAATNIFF